MTARGEGLRRFRTGPSVEVRASDPLPTEWAIVSVKRQSQLLCAERAGSTAWPDLAAAKAWIDLTPFVALAALGELCVGVGLPRLARCVGLDPLDGPDALALLRSDPRWLEIEGLVQRITLACGAGR